MIKLLEELLRVVRHEVEQTPALFGQCVHFIELLLGEVLTSQGELQPDLCFAKFGLAVIQFRFKVLLGPSAPIGFCHVGDDRPGAATDLIGEALAISASLAHASRDT